MRASLAIRIGLLCGVTLAVGIGIGRIWQNAEVWSEPQPEPATREAPAPLGMPSLAPIVRKVSRSVVGISTIRNRATLEPDAADGDSGVVHGTGFIVHRDGLIVTNHHLVAGHEQIIVQVPGHNPVVGVLVGEDPVTDIAVVRFEPPAEDLPALPLADSTVVEQGDWVLAVGNPYQYRHTVTVGIVSYVGRHIPEASYQVSNEYLQFSAPVHPGSSGGPVIDMDGNVVGVTTSAHTAGPGISFAVPTKVLKWVLRTMQRSSGRVERGYLGLGLEPLDPATRKAHGIDAGVGALVQYVERGQPAEQAGLQVGDIVVSYNGRSVPDAYTLFDWITYSTPGRRTAIEVVRHGERLPAMPVQLRAVPGDRGAVTDGDLVPTSNEVDQ